MAQDNLDILNNRLEHVMYLLDITLRDNSPASSYMGYRRSYPRKSGKRDNRRYNTKDFNDLTVSEKKRMLTEPFEKIFEQQRKTIEDCNKILKDKKSSKVQKTQARIRKEEANKVIKQTKQQQTEAQSDPEKFYRKNDFYSDESIEYRWNNMDNTDKKDYGSLEKYREFEKEDQKYFKGVEKRNQATRMITQSGLGRTKIGNFAVRAINRVSQVKDIQRFGRMLQNGGGQRLANSMFGSKNVVSKVAGKAFTNIGAGAARVAGRLNVFTAILYALYEAFKLFGKAVAEVAKYKAEKLKVETELVNSMVQYSSAVLQADTSLDLAKIEASGSIRLKELETIGTNMLEALKIEATQYAKAHEIASGYLFKGINESAYEALDASYDAAADLMKLEAGKEARGISLAATKATAGTKVSSAESETSATKAAAAIDMFNAYEMANLKDFHVSEDHFLAGKAVSNSTLNETFTSNHALNTYEKQQYAIDAKQLLDGSKRLRSDAETVGLKALGDEAIQALHDTEVAAQSLENTMRSGEANLNVAIATQNANIANAQADINQSIREQKASIAQQKAEILADVAKDINKSWAQFARNVEKFVDEIDKTTNLLGITMGRTPGQMVAFKKSLATVAEDAARAFSIDAKVLTQMQSFFAENSGRNQFFDRTDYMRTGAVGYLLGDDYELVSEFESYAELFNMDASQSSKMLGDAVLRVNRIGLNAKAFTRDLVQNFKMANKYQFKDGVEGFIKMSEWASRTRFRMETVGAMIDRIQGGGLEGILEQSARLQVMGGMPAMYSDALGMFNDAWDNTSGFGKRMRGMLYGFGTFNKKIGEVDYNYPESVMLQLFSQVNGIALEEAKNVNRQIHYENAIKKYLKQNNKKFSEDNIKLLANTAKYNTETGGWEITTANNERQDIKDINEEDLSSVETDQLKDEKIEEYVQRLVTVWEQQTGEEIAEKTNIAYATYDNVMKEYQERTEKAITNYEENRDKYIESAKKGMEEATNAFTSYLDMWKQGNEAVDQKVDKVAEGARVLNENAKKLNEAITHGTESMSAIKNLEFEPEDIIPSSGQMVASIGYSGGGNEKRNLIKDGDETLQYYDKQDIDKFSVYIKDAGGNEYEMPLKTLSDELGGFDHMSQFMSWYYTPTRTGTMSAYVRELAKTHAKKISDASISVDVSSPFNTLFEKIFPRIDTIYDTLNGYSTILPEEYLEEYEEYNTFPGDDISNVKLNFTGALKFNYNGNVIDVTDLILKDSRLKAQFTQLVSNNLMKNEFGNKGLNMTGNTYRYHPLTVG